MFEEHSVAGAGVPSVVDVDLVAAVVIPCVADVETTGCVRSLHLTVCWDKMHLNFAPEWCKWIGVVIMLLPQVGVR